MSTQIKATVPDSELERRAVAAYFRYEPPGNDGSACILDQPAGGGCVVEHKGRLYVVLSNIRGTLAIYRVLPSGRLKGLRRPPAALVRQSGAGMSDPGPAALDALMDLVAILEGRPGR